MFSSRITSARSRKASRRPSASQRRGTATVEFSLCASIIFFLFLGMIEMSRFHVLRHSLDQAVYMGARAGIVPGSTAAEVDRIVRDRMSAAGVIGGSVTITPSVIDDTTDTVTVLAQANYDQNSWTLPKYFSGVTVTSEITLDHENVAFSD